MDFQLVEKVEKFQLFQLMFFLYEMGSGLKDSCTGAFHAQAR